MSPPAGPAPAPDLRLLPAAVVCWAAAWWVAAVSARTAGAAAAGCVALTLGAAGWVTPAGRRTELRAQVLLVLACLLTVLTSAGVTLALRAAGPFPAWTGQRAVVEVTGRVTSDPRPITQGRWGGGENRVALRLSLETAAARGERRRVDVPVLVIGGSAWSSAPVGGLIRADGRLAPAEPGEDVAALFSPLGPPQTVQEPAWWWRAAAHVRAGLREAVQGLPEHPAGLLPSLVLGDTSTLSPEVEADLRASGLTHLTAVSGANVAIVVGSVLALAALSGLGLRGRVVAAGVGLAGFVVLARPEPSVLRAAVMGCVALAGLVGSRRGRGMPALGASVVVLLVVDPWLGRSPGFALSAVATGGLVLLAPVWARRLERLLPRPLALALAVPAAAQAACAPITVLLTPTVSTVAVPANLLAEPAVLPATVLGVLAAMLSLVWPWAAHASAALGTLATWWITEVAAAGARVPGAVLPWWPGLAGALLLAGATALVVVVSLRIAPAHRELRPAGRPRVASPADRLGAARLGAARLSAVMASRLRALTAVVAGVLVAVLLLGSLFWRRPGPGPPPAWAVAMCDVGQGDALVLRTGDHSAALIDVGPEPEAVDRCLSGLGVRRLDLVVLSHFHADHVLGLPGALRGRELGPVLLGPLAHPQQNVSAVQGWAAEAAVHSAVVTQETRGEVGADGWRVGWTVLPPDTPYPPAPAGSQRGVGSASKQRTSAELDESADGSVVNEASLVVLIDLGTPEGGGLRLAALGDLELEGQRRLAARLAARNEQPVDVVKVAHHGSAKQDAGLYRQLAPRVGLIGVGAGNDYGHPSRAALELLEHEQVAVYRTDRDHLVALSAGPAPQGGWASPLTVTRVRGIPRARE